MTVRIAFATAPFAAVPTWTTITPDVLAFSSKRGRQHELDRFEAGTANLIIRNDRGDYWPNNTGGAYYPNVTIGKRLNIQATYGVTTYDLFTGFIQWWRPGWLSSKGGLVPVMNVFAADLISLLSRMLLNDAVGYSEELSGTRVGNVLDSVGWPAADRAIDAGQENMRESLALVNANAMEHLYKVCESELSAFYIAPGGNADYEDRSHRTLTPHDAAVATITNTMANIDPSLDDKLLYNEIRVTNTGGTEQVAEDSTSQTNYGLHSLQRSDLLMTSDYAARSYAYYMLARYGYPALRARSITINPEKDPSFFWPKALGYDISTRITVQLTQASIDADYFIEGIEHDYDARRGEWETKWQLSDVARYLYTPDAISDTIRPDGNGDLQEFTTQFPNSTSHYDKVDEATADDDTTYVCTEHSGADPYYRQELYTLGNPPYQNGAITSVTVYIRARMTNALATTAGRKVIIKTGGTVYTGDAFALTTSYANYSKAWALNPNTGVAWAWADLNSLQAGAQLIEEIPALNNQDRLTQVWAVVSYTPTW
jgi:hypothetical protein